MSSARSEAQQRSERGQATVEFILVLPFVVIALLFAVQVAIVLRDQVELDAVTRDAALSASRTPSHQISPAVAGRVAKSSMAVRADHDRVEVTGTRTVSVSMPLFSFWISQVRLSSHAVAIAE
ncbi:MAG: TadE family protein [Acidimicrobiia bacterium]